MKYSLILFSLTALLITSLTFATPKQIIIIRHGDKLVQSDPGPALSAKGEMRAIKFAYYYLNKFPDPDYIFATADEGHNAKGSSLRELQTVAPLANMLAAKHPETGFPIYHPYQSDQFKKFAKELLDENEYDNKRVLVCWEHTAINKLSHHLGVNKSLEKWASDDFDSVYIIDYDNNGDVKNFTILRHQYPVADNIDWKKLSSVQK